MSREPERWLESEEQPELLALMRVGAEELAPPDALTRVGERLRASALARATEPARSNGDPQSARVPASKLGLRAKALGLTVLLGLAGLSLYLSLRDSPSAPAAPSAAAGQERAPSASVPSAAPSVGGPPSEAPLEPLVASPPEPSGVVEQAAPPPQPKVRAPRPPRPRADKPGLPVPSAQPIDTRLLEARLLEQARKELSLQPAHALVLLREHAAQYPASWLEEERAALLVRALVATDQRADARTQLTRFKARFPTSPHAQRLERLLAPP